MSDWTKNNSEMNLDLIHYWDMVEQVADMLSSERQVAMYLQPSSRQYELAIRGIDVPESEADNAKNNTILQSWFNEERGDPSHLPRLVDFNITDEMEKILHEVYFIEVHTRSSIHHGEALWSTNLIKAISRHAFWRIYRIDEPSKLIQLFQLLKRLVRCWNRILRHKREPITTSNMSNPESTEVRKETTLKPSDDIEPDPVIQSDHNEVKTCRIIPTVCQLLHISLTLYLAWRTFSQ